MIKKLFGKYCIVLLLFTITANSLFSQYIETRPLITVTGEAVEKTLPDIVIIRYTIANKASISEIQDFFYPEKDNLDMDMKFISVTDEEITRSMDMINYQASSYFLLREFVITLNSLAKYREVLYRLLKLNKGAIESIEFRTSRLAELKDIARTKAIEAAKIKAAAMAGALKQEIGKAFTINENIAQNINWYNYRDNLLNGSIIKENDVYLVQPGFISINANITVSFDLK